jgi:glucose dehydrogenase
MRARFNPASGAIGAFWSVILLVVSSGPMAQEHAEWPAPAGDFANTRFSALQDITTSNVSRLKRSFTFSTGLLRGHEAAPIVTNDTMYLVTPYPNVLFAIALDAPGGPLRWKYEPLPNASSQGVACCDTVNRGAAYSNGRLFFNTLDAQTVAVDAKSGAELWRVRLGDIKHGESMTMAPLVVNGKVLGGPQASSRATRTTVRRSGSTR